MWKYLLGAAVLYKLSNQKTGIGAVKKTHWHPVYEIIPTKGKNGKSTLAWTTGKSGVYLIKEDNQIVYVGSSSTNLYSTILHHFQRWKDKQQPNRLTYKESLSLNYKIRIMLCKTSKAYDLEKKFINYYQPRDNKIFYEDEFQDIESDVSNEVKAINNQNDWYPPEWD